MNNKIRKIFNYTLVFLCVFIVNSDKVFAADSDYYICSDNGQAFTIHTNKEVGLDKFYNLNTDDTTNYGKDTALVGDIIRNGKNKSTSSDGVTYSNYNSQIFSEKLGNVTVENRCLKLANASKYKSVGTYFDNGKTYNSETTYETSGIELLECGGPRLVGSPFGGLIWEDKDLSDGDNGVMNYSKDTGKITLTIRIPRDNEYLVKYFTDNRIKFYATIGDKAISGYKDETSKSIVFENIEPVKYVPGQEETQANANLFKLYLYVDVAGATDSNLYLGKGGDGQITTSKDGNVSLEKFTKSCGTNIYLAEYSGIIPFANNNLQISNKFISGTYCPTIRAYQPEDTTGEYKNIIEEFKKNYIKECYSATMGYYDYSLITEEKIEEKFNTLKKMFDSTYQGGFLKDEKNLICTNEKLGIPTTDTTIIPKEEIDQLAIPFERKTTYTKQGKYWAIACTEEYYIKSSNPDLIEAGRGLAYPNKIQINRTCSIINTKQVVKPPQCTTYASIDCHYKKCLDCNETMRSKNWTNPNTAGPNEDFDSCINSCDGGSYTQSCVNTCYEEVYGSNRKLSFSDFDAYGSYRNETTKSNYSASVSFNVTTDFDSGAYSGDIKMTCSRSESYLGKPHSCKFYLGDKLIGQVGVSNYCLEDVKKAHEATLCDVSYSKGPEGCSDNADSVYENLLNDSRTEHDEFMAIMKTINKIDEYTISIKDAKDKIYYKVTGSTSSTTVEKGPRLFIKAVDDEPHNIKEIENDIQFGSETSESFVVSRSDELVYNVDLPTMYYVEGVTNDLVLRDEDDDGNVINNNDYYTFNVNHVNKNVSMYMNRKDSFIDAYDFISYKLGNKALSDGKRVYYTQLDTGDYNVRTYTEKGDTLCNGVKIDEYVKQIRDGNVEGESVLSTNAFIYYAEEGKKVIKVLVPNEYNIYVDFKIGTIGGDTVSEQNIGRFAKSGYKCYYGIVNMLNRTETGPTYTISSDLCGTPKCVFEQNSYWGANGTEVDYETFVKECPVCEGPDCYPKGLRYYYREIKLEDVFPNDRNPRYNWSASAKNYDNLAYIIDPIKLTEDIENKGESIYDDVNEYDYKWTLTPATMNLIREYNKTKQDGKKVTYLDFSLVADVNTAHNYSQKIKDWFSDGLYGQALTITECNNATGTACKSYK